MIRSRIVAFGLTRRALIPLCAAYFRSMQIWLVMPLQLTLMEDMNLMRLKAIGHFFEHYKDLEAGKGVKVLGWEGIDSAHKEILDGIAAYKK